MARSHLDSNKTNFIVTRSFWKPCQSLGSFYEILRLKEKYQAKVWMSNQDLGMQLKEGLEIFAIRTCLWFLSLQFSETAWFPSSWNDPLKHDPLIKYVLLKAFQCIIGQLKIMQSLPRLPKLLEPCQSHFIGFSGKREQSTKSSESFVLTPSSS